MALLAIVLGTAIMISIGGLNTALAQNDDRGVDSHTQQAADHHPAPETESHGAEGEHGGGHGSIPHLQNLLIGWIAPLLPDSVAHDLEEFLNPIYSLTVALLLGLFFIGLSRKLSSRFPGRTQMAVEMVFGGLYSLFEAIIGPTARRYTPFLGTLFVFILVNNLVGMLPLGHAATSSFAQTTFALGLLTFLYVQGIAIKENGIGGYLHHLAGSPRQPIEWALVPLNIPIHILGEIAKPVSLGLRLFGNVTGEDVLLYAFAFLGISALSFMHSPIGIPFQLPFIFLALLTSTIQALVFALLSTIYILLWLPHEEGH